MLSHRRSAGNNFVDAAARLILNVGFAASETAVISSCRTRIRCKLSSLKTVPDALLVLSFVEELPHSPKFDVRVRESEREQERVGERERERVGERVGEREGERESGRVSGRVRALSCSRRALGVPCVVSFVSGVAAPSLHRGRPRSTPSLRGDSQRPPALTSTRSSRLEFPSAVTLPLGEGTYGSQPQACVRCLRAARPCRCFKRPAERIQADKNEWAGSHLTNLFQERMGWFPPYVSCFRLGWAGSHRTRPGGIFSPLAPLLRSKTTPHLKRF